MEIPKVSSLEISNSLALSRNILFSKSGISLMKGVNCSNYHFAFFWKVRDGIFAQEFRGVAEQFRDSYSDEMIEHWDYDITRFIGFSQNLKPTAEHLADFIEMHWPQNQH